jgi:hypothetical protein
MVCESRSIEVIAAEFSTAIVNRTSLERAANIYETRLFL